MINKEESVAIAREYAAMEVQGWRFETNLCFCWKYKDPTWLIFVVGISHHWPRVELWVS